MQVVIPGVRLPHVNEPAHVTLYFQRDLLKEVGERQLIEVFEQTVELLIDQPDDPADWVKTTWELELERQVAKRQGTGSAAVAQPPSVSQPEPAPAQEEKKVAVVKNAVVERKFTSRATAVAAPPQNDFETRLQVLETTVAELIIEKKEKQQQKEAQRTKKVKEKIDRAKRHHEERMRQIVSDMKGYGSDKD